MLPAYKHAGSISSLIDMLPAYRHAGSMCSLIDMLPAYKHAGSMSSQVICCQHIDMLAACVVL